MDWCSVESGSTDQGIPDSNGCFDGVEFWIEHKFTARWSPTIRAEQVGWAERRMRAGGRVFIAVRRKHEGGVRIGKPADELWLYSGWNARALLLHGLRGKEAKPLGWWDGGPQKWNWNNVLQFLVGNH